MNFVEVVCPSKCASLLDHKRFILGTSRITGTTYTKDFESQEKSFMSWWRSAFTSQWRENIPTKQDDKEYTIALLFDENTSMTQEWFAVEL